MAHRRVLVSSTAQFLKYAFNIGMSWSSTSRDTLAFLTEAVRRSLAARPVECGDARGQAARRRDDGFKEEEEEEDGEDLGETTAFLGGLGRQGLASLTLIRLAVLTWARLTMALRSPGSLAISLAGAAYFLGVVLTSLQACFASGDVVGAASSAWVAVVGLFGLLAQFARDAVREREARVTGLLRVAMGGGAAGSPEIVMLVVFTVAYSAWIDVEPLLGNAMCMLVAASLISVFLHLTSDAWFSALHLIFSFTIPFYGLPMVMYLMMMAYADNDDDDDDTYGAHMPPDAGYYFRRAEKERVAGWTDGTQAPDSYGI
ncbi:hypothetical protein HK405_011260, partial [Cladochytrium tenue]